MEVPLPVPDDELKQKLQKVLNMLQKLLDGNLVASEMKRQGGMES